MEASDEEKPLLHIQTTQVEGSEYTSDGSVDIQNQPALKQQTGGWRACCMILGVEFCELMAYFTISKNLVTYLTTALHESKVDAARNLSAWVGAYFFAPIIGAFIADAYWGRYKTIAVFLPVYIVAMLVLLASTSVPLFFISPYNGDVRHAVVYLGLYLAVIGSGGVKPCTSTFGADQFDINDPAELAKKGSFFNWSFFMVNLSSLLSGTVIVWLQDNVSWAVSYSISVVCVIFNFAIFVAGSRVYRFRRIGTSPFTSLFQVVVAALRKRHLQLPDDNSLLYELTGSSSADDENYKIKHTNQFRFFDKAAIVSVPSDNKSTSPMNPWRVCTVTQVEELKMLLQMSETWASFLIYHAVGAQMSSTLIEQPMVMDNHIGSFAIPPASLSIFHVLSILILVPLYEAVLVPLARNFTGKDKGFSQQQRLGIGLALSLLTMVYAALLETWRLAIADASGLKHQNVPVPMSILWQVPFYLMLGGAHVFASVGLSEYFYDNAPETMKSLGTALGQLGLACGSYINSLLLTVVSVATSRGEAPGWIPENLNEGHLDYFFWMMATLSLLNLAQFVHRSMRHRA